MKELAYLGRLGFHGGKLLARVLVVLLSVAGGILKVCLKSAGESRPENEGSDCGNFNRKINASLYLDDGVTPTVENTVDSQWAAYYGDGR